MLGQGRILGNAGRVEDKGGFVLMSSMLLLLLLLSKLLLLLNCRRIISSVGIPLLLLCRIVHIGRQYRRRWSRRMYIMLHGDIRIYR